MKEEVVGSSPTVPGNRVRSSVVERLNPMFNFVFVLFRFKKALLEDVGPSLIYFVTKDTNPPENCLKKYYMLVQALENTGFSALKTGTDRFGRRFWTMRR